ncbi:MAG: helix-turn-helix domain-containing protein [Rhabdochlamydiaceae bacterium]
MKINFSQKWLDENLEDAPFSGLAGDLACGWIAHALPEQQAIKPQHMFGRLVQTLRLRSKLSIEALANRINVEPEDLRRVELEEGNEPEVRLVWAIAQSFNLQVEKLNELAGLSIPRDSSLSAAAARFYASSKPIDEISPEELQALETLVGVLSEQTEGDTSGKKSPSR